MKRVSGDAFWAVKGRWYRQVSTECAAYDGWAEPADHRRVVDGGSADAGSWSSRPPHCGLEQTRIET